MALALVVVATFGGVIAASGGDGQPITATQAVAWIHAINLTPTDLPGSVPFGGEPGSPLEGAEIQRVLNCGHRGPPKGRAVAAKGSVLADRHGGWIGEVVGSAVVVLPNEALAKAEIAAFRSNHGRSCLARGFRSSYPENGASSRPRYAIRINSVPVSRLLGSEAFDLHLLATLQRPSHGSQHVGLRPTTQRPRLVYSIESVFRVGAADILFYTLSEHRRFPQSVEEGLLTRLHGRATARKL